MDIKSMTLDELKDACQQMGEKPFRAKQLYDWMHHRLAGSYDEMTNLSLAFREKLKEQYPLTCLEKVQVQESKIDGTEIPSASHPRSAAGWAAASARPQSADSCGA